MSVIWTWRQYPTSPPQLFDYQHIMNEERTKVLIEKIKLLTDRNLRDMSVKQLHILLLFVQERMRGMYTGSYEINSDDPPPFDYEALYYKLTDLLFWRLETSLYPNGKGIYIGKLS